MGSIVVPIAYLPSITYFIHAIRSDQVIIDIHEHYIKQTCRNRTWICSAGGALPLIIPVVKVFGNHTPVKDVGIDNAQRWQTHHWRAIESAYRSSPWFLFFQDDFHILYKKAYTLLADFNLDLLRIICRLAGLKTQFILSEQYISPGSQGRDLRCDLSSDPAGGTPTEPYHQVFHHKYGFIPNLSIIDLLFNLGPETVTYLERQSLQK